MKPRVWDLVRAAFNARPFGMVLPPNWVGLAAFGLLGAVNPGFWAIGAGLEIGYLALLCGNRRFRRTVMARQLAAKQAAWDDQLEPLLAALEDTDRRRHRALDARCRAILEQQASPAGAAGRDAQAQGLARLGWMHLRLLATRRAIDRVLHDTVPGDPARTDPARGDAARSVSDAQLAERAGALRRRLDEPGLADDLRRSLGAQADILDQRVAQRRAAREARTYVDAEIAQIEEQVELIREQAALQSDPDALSRRLDEIIAGLGGTNRWITEQQRIYGAVADLTVEPPPAAAARAAVQETR